MPVNLVSHGHGQGYGDLNFLIPELVDHVEKLIARNSTIPTRAVQTFTTYALRNPCCGQRTPSPPEVQGTGMSVADGFLTRAGDVDSLQW